MNCTCKVEQRRLTPGVFNLKQFLNGSETMVWELNNCVINQGTCDLKQYDAFLTLSVGGEIDEVMLTKRQNGDKLQLIWDVGTYATALTGYVKYQICFRSANFDTLGVLSDDPEANGVYSLTDQNTAGNARVFKKAENGYIIKWDAGNGRWALYKADGVTVVDYQTTPSTEPHCGVWGSVAVGNNEAAAWISDEAIMYVSETIAADQTITGGFPTILRQFWAKVVKAAGVISVNSKTGVVELSASDIGAAEEQHIHEIAEVNLLQTALNGKAAASHKHAITDVTNLQTALNGKANTSHKHQIADTEGLQNALNGKAPSSHGHTISNVTGLQAALDGKAPASHSHGYLPLTGGTVTGSITFNPASNVALLSGSGADDIFGINSADSYKNGGYFRLYGSNSTDDNKGGFLLGVSDGSAVKASLVGTPDRKLLWGGNDITLGYPNYGAATSVLGESYTAPADGWIYVQYEGASALVTYLVNEHLVGKFGGANSSIFVPVKKGDTVNCDTQVRFIHYAMR